MTYVKQGAEKNNIVKRISKGTKITGEQTGLEGWLKQYTRNQPKILEIGENPVE